MKITRTLIAAAAAAILAFGLFGCANQEQTAEPEAPQQEAPAPEAEPTPEPEPEPAPEPEPEPAEKYPIPETVEAKTSLADYSWPELKAIGNMMLAAADEDAAIAIAAQYGLCAENGSLMKAGSKPVTLTDGTQASVRIVGFMHDDAQKGGKAAMTFMFEQGVAQKSWSSSDVGPSDSWELSDLRLWMQGEGEALMPEDLMAMVETVTKKNNDGPETQDRLWCPSFIELAGELSDSTIKKVAGTKQSDGLIRAMFESFNEEGEQYKLFKEDGVSMSDGYYPTLEIPYDGSVAAWHERSCCTAKDGRCLTVSDEGHPFSTKGSDVWVSVVPFFCV